MTAIPQQSPITAECSTLGPILQAAHDIWITDAEAFLTPVAVPEATFWERWTAVGYLGDQFAAQYRRESALLQALRPFLHPATADRLTRDGERIAQLQCVLDRVGRRRGTARTVSVAAR